MPQALPSNSLEAAVRAHFGLSQDDLARYLGVARTQVAHLEAGRRRASDAQNKLLDDFARLLPPPEGSGPPAPLFEKPTLPAEASAPTLPTFGPLPAAPLRRRQRQVLAQAARLRLLLHQQGKGHVLQQRRQWGLGVLQAGLLASSAAPDTTAQAHRLRWLATLAADVAAAAPAPEAAAGHALAVVRLLALELEAAALARLLAA